MLQGKSIPHICYELFLLPERLYRNIFTLPLKILCFYLIQEPWLRDWFLLYLLWLFRVHQITNILFIWAVGDRLFPIVFLPQPLWKYPAEAEEGLADQVEVGKTCHLPRLRKTNHEWWTGEGRSAWCVSSRLRSQNKFMDSWLEFYVWLGTNIYGISVLLS